MSSTALTFKGGRQSLFPSISPDPHDSADQAHLSSFYTESQQPQEQLEKDHQLREEPSLLVSRGRSMMQGSGTNNYCQNQLPAARDEGQDWILKSHFDQGRTSSLFEDFQYDGETGFLDGSDCSFYNQQQQQPNLERMWNKDSCFGSGGGPCMTAGYLAPMQQQQEGGMIETDDYLMKLMYEQRNQSNSYYGNNEEVDQVTKEKHQAQLEFALKQQQADPFLTVGTLNIQMMKLQMTSGYQFQQHNSASFPNDNLFMSEDNIELNVEAYFKSSQPVAAGVSDIQRRQSMENINPTESPKKPLDEFEAMQPQQKEGQYYFSEDFVTPGGEVTPTPGQLEIIIQDQAENSQSDSEQEDESSQIKKVARMTKTKNITKRRGAPFKGKVSNNKVEKFKPQRQKLFRLFKQFYERRIMPGIGLDAPKRRKNKEGQISEGDQRELSSKDGLKLLGEEVFRAIPQELSADMIN